MTNTEQEGGLMGTAIHEVVVWERPSGFTLTARKPPARLMEVNDWALAHNYKVVFHKRGLTKQQANRLKREKKLEFSKRLNYETRPQL